MTHASVMTALVLLVPSWAGAQAVSDVPREAEAGLAVTVVGDLELSRADADRAAMRAARDMRRGQLQRVGQELAARHAAFWLPGVLVDGEVDRWVTRTERRSPVSVMSRDTQVFTYSYGEAFRTSLHLEDGPLFDQAAELEMERGVRWLGRLILAKIGGITVFWGLLAFISCWFDRLTRGYMTWRLRGIAAALGVVVPPVVLLI